MAFDTLVCLSLGIDEVLDHRVFFLAKCAFLREKRVPVNLVNKRTLLALPLVLRNFDLLFRLRHLLVDLAQRLLTLHLFHLLLLPVRFN